MSAGFRLTPQASEDLDGIWWYIAAGNEAVADQVEAEIVRTCLQLANHPLMGHRRPDITPLPVRFWTVPRYPNYVLVYRPETRPLQVVAILHGAQKLESILEGRA